MRQSNAAGVGLTQDLEEIVSGMTAARHTLSHRALRLPIKKRMILAALLLESIHEEAEVNSALLAELEKRSKELINGKVKGLSTEQAYGFSL